MIGNDSVLAIIPARAGSKRLPGKNLADCGGHPLIVRAILQARASMYIDAVVVTTDCPTTANLAFTNGADVVICRPPELARDATSSEMVAVHAMNTVARHGIIVLLQPTSPLRTVADIDACIDLGQRWKCVSVCDGKANGAVYVSRWDAFVANMSFSTKGAVLYEMPTERSVDIDTWDDLRRAREALSVHSMMGA